MNNNLRALDMVVNLLYPIRFSQYTHTFDWSTTTKNNRSEIKAESDNFTLFK